MACVFKTSVQHDNSTFSRYRYMKIRFAMLLTVVVAPLTLHCQDSQATVNAIPQIAVTGRGEVKVSPDRATIQVSVQTKAPTAGGAAAENATRQQSVLA